MFVSEADGSVAVQIMRGWSTVPDVLARYTLQLVGWTNTAVVASDQRRVRRVTVAVMTVTVIGRRVSETYLHNEPKRRFAWWVASRAHTNLLEHKSLILVCFAVALHLCRAR